MNKKDVEELDKKIAEADKKFAPLGKKAVIVATLKTWYALFAAARCLPENIKNRNYKGHRINIDRTHGMKDGEFFIYASDLEVEENATKRLTKRARN